MIVGGCWRDRVLHIPARKRHDRLTIEVRQITRAAISHAHISAGKCSKGHSLMSAASPPVMTSNSDSEFEVIRSRGCDPSPGCHLVTSFHLRACRVAQYLSILPVISQSCFFIYPQVNGKNSNFCVPRCSKPLLSYHARSLWFSSTMPMFIRVQPNSLALSNACSSSFSPMPS